MAGLKNKIKGTRSHQTSFDAFIIVISFKIDNQKLLIPQRMATDW